MPRMIPKQSPAPTARRARALQSRLLRWYRAHCRELPWRAAPSARANPYHVLVSEAMLQQTQVATVVNYFERFIAALPTIEALAAAEEKQVLRLWQGLGYYRRARHLHAAARAIVARHGGHVPQTLAELRALPGVGRYTAGAIASIAFDRAVPLVDGNVARVLSRWFTLIDPIDQPAARRRLWSLAEQLVPGEAPGDFNQAMMELGALVCVPRGPACLMCPVASLCEARKHGQTDQLPVRGKRPTPRTVTHHVVAVTHGGDLLFEQRPAAGLWANMWQMPTAEHLNESTVASEIGHWLADHAAVRAAPEPVGQFSHQTTHRTIRFKIWRAPAQRRHRENGIRVWRRPEELDDLPLANPQRKALAMLKESAATPRRSSLQP